MLKKEIVPIIESTHNFLKNIKQHNEDWDYNKVLFALNQTAGRGQRGNSWEAAPGKNISCSMVFRPGLKGKEQFLLSESVALAIVDTVKKLLGYNTREKVKIKWPNDIYVGDRKICGILIDHSLMGQRIGYSVISAGININQEIFLSDAPNPVSIRNIIGQEVPLQYAMDLLIEYFQIRLAPLRSELTQDQKIALHEEFQNTLYRNDGNYYKFIDNLMQEEIQARLYNIATDGQLTLELHDSTLRTYLFKEITWLL